MSSRCEEHAPDLAQYVADGEPLDMAFAALRAHVSTCPICVRRIALLREVEAALGTWPQIAAQPDLAWRILSRLPAEYAQPSVMEEWRALPWNVWVPALTLGVAVALVWVASPPGSTQGGSVQHLGARVSELPRVIGSWAGGLGLPVQAPAVAATQWGDKAFWAIWSGVCIALGGGGVSLALGTWGEQHERRWQELRQSVAQAAERVVRLAHRPS